MSRIPEASDSFHLKYSHSSAPEVLVERASREIIGQVTTAIQEHIEWYKRYLELQIRQREAIRLWKEGKKSKIIAVVEDAVQTTDASFERRRKQEAEEAHLREREEKLQRLAAWKAQKRKEVEEKCQKKMQQDEEHRKQLTTVQKRQSALKEQVTQYQREKQAAKQARKEAEEAAEEAAKAAARGVRRDPSALWERDKLLALRRQEIKLQELSAQVERCERQARILAQVPVPCVARDFNRLVAPQRVSRTGRPLCKHVLSGSRKSRCSSMPLNGRRLRGGRFYDLRESFPQGPGRQALLLAETHLMTLYSRPECCAAAATADWIMQTSRHASRVVGRSRFCLLGRPPSCSQGWRRHAIAELSERCSNAAPDGAVPVLF
eukprot:tig00020544_g10492.t1